MNAVLTALAATFCIQLGLFMWKVSAASLPRIGAVPVLTVVRALIADWRWVAGFGATVVGWLLFIQATALADISLVQPLMSVGDTFLVAMAVIFLGERLSAREWIGIVLTIVGAAALATEAASAPSAAVHGARLLVLVAASMAVADALVWAASRGAHAESALALTVGLAFGCGAALTKAMTADATFGSSGFVSWRVILDPLVLAVVGANVIGLVLLQAAFQRGRAAVVVPVQIGMANVLAMTAGVFVFVENVGAVRWVGVGLILAGTALLFQRRSA
ncbi:MAG: DMT family transporter [Rubrivivax sp.]|nr:DMT family transporter [Rubrivivax sp.]